MTGASFKTTAKAQEVKPSKPIVPVTITVNDRAATREAIIRKAHTLGHTFVTRSSWGASKAKDGLVNDWDYSMIALHHAGRSYSCGGGAEQMLETQEDHMAGKYDDIGYHYGIDCAGLIYEGRDIRFKGSSVLEYNTGVIGVVLLNNFTTAEEGDDLVSYGRAKLESWGVSTTNTIPAPQIDAVVNLITALKSVFFITRFGGHREYPGQRAEGKVCPGNIGMELVRAIRVKTQLLQPPTT
ncbi:peptidoglycan recognition family protein [Pseudomonas leptonychotis]|uniref:peptidoglycan recognition protein family protein n=1 Tax=Pseudomonas leptonychotis TaxID=2448482 RepID=UPI0038678D32